MKRLLKDGAMALSLANLCFIVTWAELVAEPVRRFHTSLSIMINVLLLAIAFWLAVTLARRARTPFVLKLGHLVFPLLLLIPLNGLLQRLLPGKKAVIEPGLLLLAIAWLGLFEVKPWHGTIIRGAKALVAVLFPFFLITFFQASSALTKSSDKPPVTSVNAQSKTSPRVLWLLFDEMDQQVTFSRRPATVKLSELDRLRGQAVYASRAYSPSDCTEVSVPALITGKLLSDSQFANISTLMITPADSGRPLSLGTQANVFSRAREAGFNTASIGYYLPCSIIGESLNQCSWRDPGALTLRESMSRQIESLLNAIPIASALWTARTAKLDQRENRQRQRDAYTRILEDAKKAALDPSLGLIFVHLPVPHPPGIYDRQKEVFELDGESSYLDNLQLADHALGDLRRVMEDAGIWEDTIVLVTSDHWWRCDIWGPGYMWTRKDGEVIAGDKDHRVPFVLKLARQREGVTYDGEFNNVLTHDLLLSLLKNEVSSPDSVTKWLDRNRSIGESPYKFMGENSPKPVEAQSQ